MSEVERHHAGVFYLENKYDYLKQNCENVNDAIGHCV